MTYSDVVGQVSKSLSSLGFEVYPAFDLQSA